MTSTTFEWVCADDGRLVNSLLRVLCVDCGFSASCSISQPQRGLIKRKASITLTILLRTQLKSQHILQELH